jgi:hypothetical protein
MRGSRFFRMAIFSLTALTVTGCHAGQSKRSIASSEPMLSPTAEGGTPIIVEGTPARTVTYVDRHPLLSKPREYYEGSTSNNVIGKSARAVVVGVPVGIYGELKQIVVGTPAVATTATSYESQ